jgi:ABC-type multidrug transport system fused ATPase/permease subunit
MRRKNLFGRMLAGAKGSRKLGAVLPIIMILEAALTIGLARLFRAGIDKVLLGGEDYAAFAYGAVGVIMLSSLLGYLRNRIRGSFSERAAASLRCTATRQFAFLPIADLERMHSGDSISKLTNDLQAVKRFLDLEGYLLASRPLLALVSFAYMLQISWQLCVATALFTPLMMLATAKISAPLQAYSKSLQEELGKVNSASQDILGGMEVVKAFNLQDRLSEDFARRVRAAVEKGRMIAVRRAFLTGVSSLLTYLPFVVPFSLGSLLISRGLLSVGGLLAFINLSNHLTWPLAQVPRHFAGYKTALAALERIYEIIDLPVERETGQGYPADSAQVVEFSAVDFGYTEEPVLQDLSFSISRGEKVAIVGPSGSGKSTIFNLITGCYQQDKGCIQIFGQSIENWNLQALRSNMAVVAQDTFLFPTTIRENIALGLSGVSLEEIVLAAQKANAHQFIMSLPEQYDTVVGERGAKLSGGQMQRIAIARAILHDAELLLLDEATSALDTEAEYSVQQAIERAMEGRTTIVIAHRLSTIKGADRILVLDHGRIVESGTHCQLMELDGLYANLYQTEGVA